MGPGFPWVARASPQSQLVGEQAGGKATAEDGGAGIAGREVRVNVTGGEAALGLADIERASIGRLTEAEPLSDRGVPVNRVQPWARRYVDLRFRDRHRRTCEVT